jgi:16S rRNA (guanine527-N7)-methyltransferase
MDILKKCIFPLGISLTGAQIDQFETYYHELISWNEKVNLTSITDFEEVQIKHFLDSLTVAMALGSENFTRPLNIIDVGTGAGLPGLPLKIALPQIRLTLLEATAKKTRFLSHLITELGLQKVNIVTGRAEEVAHEPAYREAFDIVLARALAPLPALVELALPFCAVGGRLIAHKKGNIREEIEQSKKAIETLGGAPSEVKPVELEGLEDNRTLVIINKVKSSPAAYPRRPGIPVKRPIRA